jgi:hypothetical protein
MSKTRSPLFDPEDSVCTDQEPEMACGRGDHLAPDVAQIVHAQCPRCMGTGSTCMIDLVYAEAFPSRRNH